MVVIGAGGHAKEVFEIIQLSQYFSSEKIFFFDDINMDKNEIFGLEILHKWNEIPKGDRLILSVGTPGARKALYNKAKTIMLNDNWMSTVAPNASVSQSDVHLGQALNIMQFVMISPSVKIGDGTLINTGAIITHDVQVGNFCDICPKVLILGGCQIGDEVSIGSGAIVLPKIKVGDGAKIAAGAVVIKDVSAGVTVAGIPAKLIK